MSTPVRWESIQPGCVIIRYNPERIKLWEIQSLLSEETWHEMTKRGFYGGLILPMDVELQSLNLKELESLGLEPKRVRSRKTKERK